MSNTSKSVIDLGLIGGMFDPVHNGHINIALSSFELLRLDELQFLPCGKPVHKHENFASPVHRLAMLALAVSNFSKINIDSRECQSDEPSYTQRSLLAIRSENPDSRLFFILGQDAFNSLATWYNWKAIFSLAHFVIAERPDSEINFPEELLSEFENRHVGSIEEMKQYKQGKVLTAPIPLLDISSTMIRNNIDEGKGIQELVPSLVAQYIYTQKLYISEGSV
ncbi:MAG: nicotinate-nucleotide adenylyltransferase [Pseudomonadales bacterium]